MTFPCLICGQLPIVDSPEAPIVTASVSGSRVSISAPSGIAKSTSAAAQSQGPARSTGGGGGTTIRTLSKDVSDKIFQNLCKHLVIKSEPSWFNQNPGEQMPLCAACSAAVLEIYTLQTKVDHFTSLIKKHVCKLERIVADTEIATNWLATKDEEEEEEQMWNSIPCAPTTIRIARERHDKFRNQILQNFKNKVKQRMKLRAAGQQDYDSLDVEPTLQLRESVAFENGERSEGAPPPLVPVTGSLSQGQYTPPFKKLRMDNNTSSNIKGKVQQQKNRQSPAPSNSGGGGGEMNFFKFLSSQREGGSDSRQGPSTSVGGAVGRAAVVQEDFHDESEVDDDHEQAYPDVQIVCAGGSVDFDGYKEETDFSNDNDGEEYMESSGAWYTGDGDDDEEAMVIPDGEEVVWLAHNVALRKSFLEQLLIENLKPSVFLRKLMFAVFGVKQIANSSGTTGSNKPGAKPSLDRVKFEALRDFTIDTYGIRDNLQELDDLNRKIRTICCDARKALKRKAVKTLTTQCTQPIKTEQQSFEGFNSNSNSGHRAPLNSSLTDNLDDFAEVTGVPTEEVLPVSVSINPPGSDSNHESEQN